MAEMNHAVKIWEEMDKEVLLMIFMLLNVIDMASVSKVCRSWRLTSRDPWLWSTLDLGLLKSNFIQTTVSPYVWVSERSDAMLLKLLRLGMGISHGNITILIFHFNLYMKDDHLNIIAESCPRLKRLVLPAWNRITKTGICQAMRKWQGLESLTMPSMEHPLYIMKELSESCKNLSSLKIMGPFNLNFASQIVTYLPNLRIMSLRCSLVTKEALLFILDCMDRLEVLNISQCMLVQDFTPQGRSNVIRELDQNIVRKVSRLCEFYCCLSLSCTACQRMVADGGLMRWYRYEHWFWREDEVASLSIGRDYGSLVDQRLLNMKF